MRHFRLTGIAPENISTLLANLPAEATLVQLTISGKFYQGWGRYTCPKETLMDRVRGYCWRFSEAANFMDLPD